MKKIIIAITIVVTIAACTNNAATNNTKPDILTADMDSTVKPGDDFFDYANGGWIKRNPIPADQSSWGIGNLVIEENLKRLREISEKSAAANAAKGSNNQKIGDFWTMAIDSAKIEADGLKPIQALLDKLNAVTDTKSLIDVIAQFKQLGTSTLFDEYIAQDAKQSDVMSYTLWQGGLGLGQRDYYFKTDSATTNIRNEYLHYITKILTMAGEEPATAAEAGKNILAMETKLATASRKLEDLRNPYSNYNKMAIGDLKKMSANIDWPSYLKNIGVQHVDSVIVGQPEFFKAVSDVLASTPINDLKHYVKFNLLNDLSAVLPDAYGVAAFNFGKLFSGAKERKPRWKRAIQLEENAMGELLGQLYVKEFFNETAKKRYTKMVEDIREALKDRIGKLTWMSDSTKAKAYIKLAAIKSKVGYPDKWKDFSTMEIGRESFAQNFINAKKWWHQYNYNKLG
ncbi:MAG TPA: M13 family metallopeptidase N-terminal domain-containing protein, partial [Ferruginibacter sp.]|nr:M13 family metallopeptidase N-terminal domain-containing protein [Ferruginibacter sp.]